MKWVFGQFCCFFFGVFIYLTLALAMNINNIGFSVFATLLWNLVGPLLRRVWQWMGCQTWLYSRRNYGNNPCHYQHARKETCYWDETKLEFTEYLQRVASVGTGTEKRVLSPTLNQGFSTCCYCEQGADVDESFRELVESSRAGGNLKRIVNLVDSNWILCKWRLDLKTPTKECLNQWDF